MSGVKSSCRDGRGDIDGNFNRFTTQAQRKTKREKGGRVLVASWAMGGNVGGEAVRHGAVMGSW
jgi:hypothetical protein